MDYKTQLKKRLSATSDTTASDSESDFMRGLRDRVAKAQNPYLNVDNEYIESFGKKYEKYATDTQNTKMNYDNAVTKYKGNVVTGNGLQKEADNIRSFYYAKRKDISKDNYKAMMEYLDSVDENLQSAKKYYRGNYDYYSQFDSEDDYNSRVTYPQKYEGWTYSELSDYMNTGTYQMKRKNGYISDAEDDWLKYYMTHDRDVVDSMTYDQIKAVSDAESARESQLDSEIREMYLQQRKNALMPESARAVTSAEIAKKESEKSSLNGVLYYDENGEAVTYDRLRRIKKAEEGISKKYGDGNDGSETRILNDLDKIQVAKAIVIDSQGYLSNDVFESATEEEKSTLEYFADNYGIDFHQSTDDALAQIDELEDLAYYEQWKKDKAAYKEKQEKNRQYAIDHPVASEIFKFFTIPVRAIEYLGNAAYALGSGNDSASGLANIYDDEFTNFSQTASSTIAENIKNGVASSTGSDLLAWLASTAYSATSSALQSAATTAACTFLFGPAGSAISLGIMGGEAAASSFQNAVRNGSTNGEALLTSLASGINEALFEKLSLENLKGIKNIVNSQSWNVSSLANLLKSTAKNSGKVIVQGLVEASEEGFTDVFNTIADQIINGDHSEYNTNVMKLMNSGYSKEDAEKLATQDWIEQILGSLYGGFVGGTASGGLRMAMNTALGSVDAVRGTKELNRYIKDQGTRIVDNDNVSKLVNDANAVEGNKKLHKLASELARVNTTSENFTDSDRKSLAKKAGKLYYQLQTTQAKNLENTQRQAFEGAVREELQAKGVENVDKTAKAITKKQFGGEVSKAEATLIESVGGDEIAGTISESDDFKKGSMRKLTENYKTYRDTNALSHVSRSDAELGGSVNVDMEDRISEDGKTRDTSTGKEVTINKKDAIAYKKNGEVYLNTDQGEVAMSKVSFGTESDALLYQAFADMDAVTASSVIANYDGSIPVTRYINGMRQGINVYGKYNFKGVGIDISSDSFFADLSATDQQYALNLGRIVAKAQAKKEAETIATKTKGVSETVKSKGKGTVTFEKGVAAKTEMQKKGVSLAKHLASAMGIEIVFFDSTKDAKHANDNGWYNPADNSIHVDINAGGNLEGTIAYTLGHEVTHFIKEWSPAKFKAFSDFLIEQYGEHGKSVQEMLEAQMAKLGTKDVDIAMEELVADACETMLLDSNAVEKLAELRQKDATIFDKIKQFIENLLTKLREMYKKYEPDSTEAKELRKLTDVFGQIADKFSEAAVDATTNYKSVNVAVQNDTKTKKSTRQANPYGIDLDSPINVHDVETLRSIGRKSINDFNGSDIAKSVKWAHKFYQELGTKSPFFRAWFGDYRSADKSETKIADIPEYVASNESRKANRGNVVNADTGWNIRISREGETNTISHAGDMRLSEYGLSGIRDLIENAVLLDSEVHEHHSNNAKNDLIAFDHKLYALGQDNDGNIGLYKITVEEVYQDKTHPGNKKFHNLKYIEKVAKASADALSENLRSGGSTMRSSTTNYNVSQLYSFVKRFDKDFNAGKAVNPKLLNRNGRPRVMYHYTDGTFTVFDPARSGSNQGMRLGDGIYISSSKTAFMDYGKNRMEVYADIKRPFEMKLSKAQADEVLNTYAATKHNLDAYGGVYRKHAQQKLMTPTRVMDYLSEYATDNGIKTSDILKHLGYDGIHDGIEWVAFDPAQIKSATDNIGTFDRNNPDIRYSKRNPDAIPNREILINALETTAQNESEKNALNQYRESIGMLEELQDHLDEVKEEIKRLSFSKGTRDMKALRALKDEKIKTVNRINIYDGKLLRIEATKPIRDFIARNREALKKKYQQKGRELLRESATKHTESINKKVARDRLQKMVSDTERWITSPSKTDIRCPDALKEPYMNFLASINLSSQKLLSGKGTTQADMRNIGALDALANVVERIKNAQNPNRESTETFDAGYLDLPENYVNELRSYADAIRSLMNRESSEEHIVNRMTAEQIRGLVKSIRTLNKSIRDMSRAYANHRFDNIRELGDKTVQEMSAFDDIKRTNEIYDFLQWDNVTPLEAFKRFGESGESVFEELMDAQDKLAFLSKDIFDFKDKTWTSKEVRDWGKDTHTMELPSGASLTLTSADAMSIYCLSRREAALAETMDISHLTSGGVRVIGKEKNKSKTKDSIANLTSDDVKAICDSLSDRQKTVADAIQKYMSTVCAEWGNEITMKRFLTRDFTEQYYFPFESDDLNMTVKDPSAQQSDLFRLLNISAAKPLTRGANNRVIIRNVFDVFASHATDMAKLNSFGLALLDVMKWFNYTEKTVNDLGQITVRGVRNEMDRVFGGAAKKYVLNLIKDINGSEKGTEELSLPAKMLRNAKTAAVASNLGVALLQFTALSRARLILSDSSIVLGLTKKPQIKKAEQYCGIALWKSFGFYDINISKNIETQIKGNQSLYNNIIEKAMIGAELGDKITWGYLWNACEYEIAKQGKYSVGSEQFNQEVAKKLREVVYSTQVVDSTLTKTQIMRNKSSLTKQITAFMAEPLLSVNLLISAYTQVKQKGWKAVGKYARRAISAYIISQIIPAVVEAFRDSVRDDDDEKSFLEKFLSNFWQNAVQDLLIVGKIPMFKDLESLLLSKVGMGYFDIDRMDQKWMMSISDAWDTWAQIINKGDESDYTIYNGIYQTANAFSQATGLPISNAMREVVTFWNNTAGLYNKNLKIRKKTADSNKRDKYIDFIETGNTSDAKSCYEEWVEYKKEEFAKKREKEEKIELSDSELTKKAKESIKQSVSGYFKDKVKEHRKDNEALGEIRKEMYSTGLFGSVDEVIATVNNWLKDYK